MADQLISLAAPGTPAPLLNYRGEWNAFFGYAINDNVIWNGIAYTCYLPVAAITNTDPLFQNLPQVGRVGPNQAINGLITTNDPVTAAIYPQGGAGQTVQVWTFNVTTAGTFNFTVGPADTTRFPPFTLPSFDLWKPNGAGQFGSAVSPFSLNPVTLVLGIHHFVAKCVDGSGTVRPPPQAYSFSIAPGTGVAGPGTGNTAPDVDLAHWAPVGV